MIGFGFRSVTAVVAAVVVLAGCGGSKGLQMSPDEHAIRGVLSKLESFSRSGDGARICTELFTPRLAASVAQASRTKNCAQEIRAHVFTPRAVVNVNRVAFIDSSTATARITVQGGVKDDVSLVKFKNQWRIRGIQQASPPAGG